MKDKVKIQKIIIGILITLIVASMIIGPVVILKSRANKNHSNNYEEIEDIDDLPEEVQKIIKTTPKDSEKQTEEEKAKQKIKDEINKETQNIIDKIEDENTTDEYKEYEKLPEEEKAKLDVIPRKQKVDFKELDEIKEKIGYDENTNYPAKYNSIENANLVIGNQDSTQTCWDYATTTVLEANLYKTKNETNNFSEVRTDYIMSNKLFGERDIHDGGTFDWFKKGAIIAGVVQESDKLKNNIDYSKDDYIKFLDMQRDSTITETVSYPKITKMKKGENDKNELQTSEQIEEFRNVVKYHIMKYGALYASVDITSEANPTGKDLYCAREDCESNHAIAIIGWDDNFPKEEFEKGNYGQKPEHNGAYLAQNSYGKEWGRDGLFYISYDDVIVDSEMEGIISTDLTENNSLKLSQLSKPFRDFIKDKYGIYVIEKDGEEYLLKETIEKEITSIELNNMDLTDEDLKSVKYFKGIYSISLDDNNLTNIDVLKDLEKLIGISVRNNKIEDVSIFADKKINIMGLDGNKNIKGYSKIKSLNVLSLIDCDITELESLSETNISTLYLSDNKNLNLDFSMLPKELGSLDLKNTNLQSLEGFNLEKIYSLYINNNPISSLKGLEKVKSIFVLNISKTNIRNVDIINNFDIKIDNDNPYSYGMNLMMDDCGIDDISIFNNINVISDLSLKNNNITDLSNYDNDKIRFINLSGNKIKKGFSKSNNIKFITLEDCGINDLSVILKLENLTSLYMQKNNIKNIDDITELKKLQILDLSFNDIEDIDPLNDLKELTSLSLEGNHNLKGLIVNSKINQLNLASTNITPSKILDIRNIQNVYMLNLSNNDASGIYDLISGNREDTYLRIILENVKLEDKEVEKLMKFPVDKIRIQDYAFEYKLPKEEDSNRIELNSDIRNMLIKGHRNYNKDVEFDKFYKYIELKNDIEEYDFDVNIPDTIFEGSKIKLVFDDTKEQEDSETNFRKIRKHKEHIRRG